MDYEEKRKLDNEKEARITNLGHERIIEKYLNASILEIVNDTERQHKGIDVIIDYNGKKINVDEKVSVDWVNTPRYSFELLCKVNKGGNGWFASNISETDYYLIYLQVDDTGKPCKLLNEETDEPYSYEEWEQTVKRLEIMFISKQKIVDFIKNELGYSMDDLVSMAKEIRNGERKFKLLKYKVAKIQEDNLKEKPVSLKIELPILKSLADIVRVTNIHPRQPWEI